MSFIDLIILFSPTVLFIPIILWGYFVIHTIREERLSVERRINLEKEAED
jgi:hypothetical protein